MEEIECGFTLQELAAMRQLLNAALMARGIEVASAALTLDQKIVAAVNAYGAALSGGMPHGESRRPGDGAVHA